MGWAAGVVDRCHRTTDPQVVEVVTYSLTTLSHRLQCTGLVVHLRLDRLHKHGFLNSLYTESYPEILFWIFAWTACINAKLHRT
jgi:hypothetical protein